MAENLQYDLPLCFGVVDAHTYYTHIYFQNQYIEDIQVIFPYSKMNCGKENVHIINDEDTGIVYDAHTNHMLQISPSFAKHLKAVQNIPCKNRNTSLDWAMFQYFYSKNWGDKKTINYYEPTTFLDSRILHKLEIMIQTDCNLACKYCYADGGHYGYGKQHLTKENAVLYLEKLIHGRLDQINTVQFFGGEPTMYPDTIEAICQYFQYAVENGSLKSIPVYTMVTNLVNLSEKMIDLIVKFDIRITVSLDGPKEINDQLRVFRSGVGTFDNVKHSLDCLQSRGAYPLLAEATYTKLHQEQGYTKEDIHTYLKEQLHIPNVVIGDCIGDSSYALSKSQSVSNKDMALNIYPYLAKFLLKKEKSRFKCNAGCSMISLLPNGKIYPCHLFLPNEEYCIATFENGNWNFNKYPAAYNHILNINMAPDVSCTKCWARIWCNACQGELSKFNKEEMVQFCKSERAKIEQIILNIVHANSNENIWNNYLKKLKKLAIIK